MICSNFEGKQNCYLLSLTRCRSMPTIIIVMLGIFVWVYYYSPNVTHCTNENTFYVCNYEFVMTLVYLSINLGLGKNIQIFFCTFFYMEDLC
jgi:hypothetical protein